MKPTDQKAEFIRLRAEGKSYSAIAETLHISKGTCTSWEREFKDAISELKQDQLTDLYNAYYMTKEARIKKLGETMGKINKALDEADLSQIPPEKLLELKLKYMEALKAEYTGNYSPYPIKTEKVEPKDIVTALADLFNRVRAGDITNEQASKESAVMANLLKAYDMVTIKEKLDAIEAVMDSRAD